MFSPCSAKRRASDKDLPVPEKRVENKQSRNYVGLVETQ